MDSGQILAVQIEKDAFSSDGIIDLDRTKPALYVSRDHYITVDLTTLKAMAKKSG